MEFVSYRYAKQLYFLALALYASRKMISSYVNQLHF